MFMRSGLKLTFMLSTVLLKSFTVDLEGQNPGYWNNQMTDESFLLGGAVVGGGAGVGAVYYNPALISENKKSNFAVNLNLLSIDIYRIENALGNGIHLENTQLLTEPRFFSFLARSKKYQGLSFQFVGMGKEFYNVKYSDSQDKQMDILTQLPGNERYFANYKQRHQFEEYWIGGGASYKMNSGFSAGVAMFGLLKSLNYNYLFDIEANPLSDTIYVGEDAIPFYTASTGFYEFVRFDNYRLRWKIGFAWTFERINIGLTITTPSVHISSGVKRVTRQNSQRLISNPDGSGFLPEYYVADEQVKNDLEATYKDPLSIAIGIVYRTPSEKNHIYATAEHFFGIEPYKFITATENPDIAIPAIYQDLTPKDWLSYVTGADPVTNLAIGYKRQFKDNLILLTGFKTDFSYLKDFSFGSLEEYNRLLSFDVDIIHLSAGLLAQIRGNSIFAGIQYSLGTEKEMKQLVNLADPVEYNESEGAALQGDRLNNMSFSYNGLSLLIGLTLRFGFDNQ
jgi:hypothetical protein